MTKEELIQEITDQLQALSRIAVANKPFTLSETIALFYLQFRLKCKLYELTQKEGETNE